MQRREKKPAKFVSGQPPSFLDSRYYIIAPFTICSDLLTEHQELAKV